MIHEVGDHYPYGMQTGLPTESAYVQLDYVDKQYNEKFSGLRYVRNASFLLSLPERQFFNR